MREVHEACEGKQILCFTQVSTEFTPHPKLQTELVKGFWRASAPMTTSRYLPSEQGGPYQASVAHVNSCNGRKMLKL